MRDVCSESYGEPDGFEYELSTTIQLWQMNTSMPACVQARS